jgi:UDP-N-acetyl-D-galactosamine dehydrogenase
MISPSPGELQQKLAKDFFLMVLDDAKIAVIGLGYVGLPLAVEFAKKYPVVGFDISSPRITELRQGKDSSLEVDPKELAEIEMEFTDQLEGVRDCNVYIVTVPTPIDEYKNPDLSPLISASRAVGKIIGKGDIVIYESTVYPGATEEDCIPVIEEVSGLRFNEDFFAGYSPERINPGDKEHRVTTIKKVTSGSTPEIARFVDDLYASIIVAGTHLASSIKVAEAAKVIENTQRDVNIALINELSLIFGKLGIDTEEVLKAAGTKWNFLPFRPGLVGGHCIGVDPYYLTHKAQAIGYHPAMILAGRRINDSMGSHVAGTVVKLMLQRGLAVNGGRVLIMGLTFKENCPDLRNTRVTDIIEELQSFGMHVDVWDPWVNAEEARHEYGISPIGQPESGAYEAMVLAVSHREFAEMGVDSIRALGKPGAVLFDVKYLFPAADTDGRL